MVVRIEKHKTQAIFLSLNHFKCKYNNSIDISSLLLLSLFFVQGTHVPRPVSHSWICWSYATYSLFAPYIWFTWFFTCPIYYLGFFRVVLCCAVASSDFRSHFLLIFQKWFTIISDEFELCHFFHLSTADNFFMSKCWWLESWKTQPIPIVHKRSTRTILKWKDNRSNLSCVFKLDFVFIYLKSSTWPWSAYQ